MGNCECVQTSKCGFGDNSETDPHPKLKIVTSDELVNESANNQSLISFSTISVKELTMSKSCSSYFPKALKEVEEKDSLNEKSKQTSTWDSRDSQENQSFHQIQITQKISLKEYYDLKKMIEKINKLFEEINIKKSFIVY